MSLNGPTNLKMDHDDYLQYFALKQVILNLFLPDILN